MIGVARGNEATLMTKEKRESSRAWINLFRGGVSIC